MTDSKPGTSAEANLPQAPQIPAPMPFDPEKDEWSIYQERMEQYMVSQRITTPEDKKAALISLMGNTAYKQLRDMCWPAEVNTKTFNEICALLKPQYAEAVVVHHARREFYRATKIHNEPAQQLLLRLRGLASKCAFSANYDSILLDKIVSIQEGRIFDRLCEEDATLTLEQAMKIILRKEGQLQMQEQTVNYHQARETSGHRRPVHTRLGEGPSTGARYGQQVASYQRTQRQHKEERQGERRQERRIRCIHCGGTNHSMSECMHKNASCYFCKQLGHIATNCPKKRAHARAQFIAHKQTGGRSTESNVDFDADLDSDYDIDLEVPINNINNKHTVNSPYNVFLTVNNKKLEFQIDTGAGISAISSRQYKEVFGQAPMEKTAMKLSGYSGETLHTVGVIKPQIELNGNTIYGRIYIVHNGGPPIVGRNILTKLGFNYEFKLSEKPSINLITNKDAQIAQICDAFPELFDGKLGEYKLKTIKLALKPDAIAKFVRARPVPFAFQKQYDDEFDALENLGVITRTDTSEWGTPVVPVLKPNGKIRLCGDYKTTINPHLVEVKHPLPRVEELFAKLQGGQLFTKLDLSRGYNQLVLDEPSRKLVAISTHRGVYLMNRLPFGISPASGIFQREIERILQGIPNVVNFIDDILITGKNNEEHLQTMKQVLKKLNQAGLKLEKSKCEFFQAEVTYLGYTISKYGLKKCKKTVDAIAKAPVPTNVTEVKSFCGLANYYGKFVSNMAGTLSPLYKLLRKDVKFDWSTECNKAFETIKRAIMSDNILTHFNPNLPVVLTCDASNHGIGAVLSHRSEDKVLKPIAFASRTLNPAETNYSTIHKEGLAIIFGVKKFYQFLIGRHFVLQTDHKPLVSIFKPANGIPVMAAGRVQRWAVYLSGFDYSIEHVKTDQNVSDTLSRLPLPDTHQNSELNEESAYLHFMKENFPSQTVTHKDIRRESRNDIEISTIANAVRNNNLRSVIENKPEFKSYKNKENELAVEKDILMWGGRVVIPRKLRELMLKSVHSTHMGVVKTKSLCRSHFWWPNLDNDVETMIKGCEQCSQLLPDPRKAELIPWRSEERPWSRIHLDFAGPIKGAYLLIIVDSFSKWIEVFITKNPNAEFTLEKLYETACRFGLPDTIVTDNGVQFKNIEFETFTASFGIKHVFSAPGFPATNGQAESAVKIVKKGIRAVTCSQPNRDIKCVVNQFLFDYRTTPHTSTMESPAKLMFKRNIRCRFSVIRPPSTLETIENQQRKQVKNYNGSAVRPALVGDRVWARDYTNPNKKGWASGQLKEVLGKRNFLVQLDVNGRLIKRHIDQLRIAPQITSNNNKNTDYTSDGEAERERIRDGTHVIETMAETSDLGTRPQATDAVTSPISPASPHNTNRVSDIGGGDENTEQPGRAEAIPEEVDAPEIIPSYPSTRVRRKPDRLGYPA